MRSDAIPLRLPLRADFGYVLGMRDPKQWAKVPVPLKRDIIAAMGGQGSEDYKHFRKLAVEAYIILRKHASLFLTLLSCMAGSSIDCFSVDAGGVNLDFILSQVRPAAPDSVHVFVLSWCCTSVWQICVLCRA
jgi:Phosphatidylinositol 3- and 4-kinase